MLESILRVAGWRTGLYTSPHLVKLGERVQVDRQQLTEDEIVAYARDLQPVAARAAAFAPDEHATFFEFMTAMAFLQFQRRQVDAAIIEVGMGGRLDATNVVQPAVSVITSIGLDHVAELGDTVERIAAEKAGIVKPGRPVVIGRLPPGAERVIREVAAANGAPVHSVREIFGEELAGYPTTNLEGDHQRWNAATATVVARLFGAYVAANTRWNALSERVQGRAARRLRHLTSLVDWPTCTGPDAGSVSRSAGATLFSMPRTIPRGQRCWKRPCTGSWTKPAGSRSSWRACSANFAPVRCLTWWDGTHGRFMRSRRSSAGHALRGIGAVGSACRAGVDAGEFRGENLSGRRNLHARRTGDTIVVTGSIYLLGEILERLEPRRGAGEGRLQDFLTRIRAECPTRNSQRPTFGIRRKPAAPWILNVECSAQPVWFLVLFSSVTECKSAAR
ncbi:MAG: Mur ligase family protein [Lacunisphaera sp.]